MGSSYGTLDLIDTMPNPLIGDFGFDKTFDLLKEALDKHNAKMQTEVLPLYAEITNYHLASYKPAGAEGNDYPLMCIPLDQHRLDVAWTEEWLKAHSLSDICVMFSQMKEADLRAVQKEIKKAIYHPDNRLCTNDEEIDDPFMIYAFSNGDGMPIQDGGGSRSEQHSHYMAAQELNSNTLREVINNVIEHGIVGEAKIFINRAQEAQVWGMYTSDNFAPYVPKNIDYGKNYAMGRHLSTDNGVANRAIGCFDGYEVWVKPWVIPNTIVVMDTGVNSQYDDEGNLIRAGRKPLACRQHKNLDLSGLNFYGSDEYGNLELKMMDSYQPLFCSTIKRFIGFAPHHRHMVAVLQLTDGEYSIKRNQIAD